MTPVDPIRQFDIDFLPARYREQCVQRKKRMLQLVGAGLFALVLLACAAWQWQAGRRLAQELERIAPIHEGAHERTVQLTTLKHELSTAQAQADLLAYLKHPWPKTQLIAAVIEPMPVSIKLSDLTIGRQEEDTSAVALPSQRNRNRGSAPDANSEIKVKLTPTEADLEQLRAEFDPRTLVINMTGETTNVSELHEYLGRIALHKLIVKAELRSIEAGGRDAQGTMFRARIVVRAGYGQPNGPVQPATQSDPAPTTPEVAAERDAAMPPQLARAGS